MDTEDIRWALLSPPNRAWLRSALVEEWTIGEPGNWTANDRDPRDVIAAGSYAACQAAANLLLAL